MDFPVGAPLLSEARRVAESRVEAVQRSAALRLAAPHHFLPNSIGRVRVDDVCLFTLGQAAASHSRRNHSCRQSCVLTKCDANQVLWD